MLRQICVLLPVGSLDHVVHSDASGARNFVPLFLMLRWDYYGFDKKCAGTRYAKLVFLLQVGSACHVVHSDASGARNGDAPFFMLGWGLDRFDKKSVRTHYGELVFCIR
jgi:hypothetical protein